MAAKGGARRPRTSAEVYRSSVDELHARHRRRSFVRTVFTLGLIAFLVWGANVTLIGKPLKSSLASDPATAGIPLAGHLRYYVDPTTLILDLKGPLAADTDALFRGALLASHSLVAPQLVKRVIFAHLGAPVFEMSGMDYRRFGDELAAGRNPVLVLRELPAALRGPLGGTVDVGDAATAARRWAGVVN
jgi:hypothetical protein